MKFVSTLLKRHLQRYPQMQLADIYKLLHQASMGAAHAAPLSAALDDASVRESIERELREAGAGPGEPLIDPISPDERLARVHLRAYAAAGGAIDALAQAFVATAQQAPRAPDKLERFCACLGDFADTGEIAFDAAQVRAYFAHIAAAGYPAVRHSEIYRAAYRPAYRVVDRELLNFD